MYDPIEIAMAITTSHLVVHPTNRLGGLVDPGDFNGIFVGAMSTYNWGELTHLLTGMNHQL